jgi:Fur family transcriptional regulator, iron response regulator
MRTIEANLGARAPGSEMEQRFNRFLAGGVDRHPRHRYKSLLRRVGLRPTHQRLVLAHILFSGDNRHVTAEMLHEEAVKARMPLSLATVYNTLKQFTEAGLLSQICVDGSKAFFDTNPSEHHHFFIESEGAVLDIPGAEAIVDRLPQAPEGFEIARVSVVIRLRRSRS